MGRLAGRLGAGQRHHAAHGGIFQRRLARRAGGVADEAIDAGFGEPPLPAPDRRPADPGAARYLGDAQPLGRMEDDSSPRHMLLRAVAIGDDRPEPSAILSRHQGADILSHMPKMPHPPLVVNPPNASVH